MNNKYTFQSVIADAGPASSLLARLHPLRPPSARDDSRPERGRTGLAEVIIYLN